MPINLEGTSVPNGPGLDRRPCKEAASLWFDRRRTFVINRKLQFSVLLTSLGHVGFLTLVVTLALFAPLVVELRQPNWDSPETTDAALQILYLHRDLLAACAAGASGHHAALGEDEPQDRRAALPVPTGV